MIFCVERAEDGVQFTNVGALAGAEAEMVQADALLFEGSALMLGRWRADPDPPCGRRRNNRSSRCR